MNVHTYNKRVGGSLFNHGCQITFVVVFVDVSCCIKLPLEL